MIFSSPEFLVFFVAFLPLYWAARGPVRLVVLLVGSLVFYVVGSAADVGYLGAVIAIAYCGGRLVDMYPKQARAIVAVSIAALLGVLAYAKYARFLLEVVGIDVPGGLLPLGVSFFTFEGIAYLVDVLRGTAPVERSPLRLALYVSVFPHMISGPIMRANELLPQLKARITASAPQIASGLQLFAEGLAKKVLLADTVAPIVDRVFADPTGATWWQAWAGALGFTVQIYGDFAGYTDMARGVARLLGLDLPVNFDAPYAARSITDFWRRWHMTLSRWLRDYLYVALGGNRSGRVRTYVNLLLTMLLGGLWHGPGWTFVAWGGYHGALLALERARWGIVRLPTPLASGWTLILVVMGWVLFRAGDFRAFLDITAAMYLPRDASGLPDVGRRDLILVVALFVVTVVFMHLAARADRMLECLRMPGARLGLAHGAMTALILIYAALQGAPRTFIYFRF